MLVEYEENSDNLEVTDHDIDVEGFSTIRINKIKTDNYAEIYSSIAKLQLPVSAMDIRKIQTAVKEIYFGGCIKVSITNDLDELENVDKVMIQSQQFFPIYAFAKIDPSIKRIEKLKKQQNSKLEALKRQIEQKFDVKETTLEDILNNESYAMTYKNQIIAYALLKGNFMPEDIEEYLKTLSGEIGNTTDYRRLLCAYDYVKYSCD
ncbi:hypothetical protein BHF70_07200 [Anaerostipes sp. 494a]|nr:hypothetical protein BHF70_07200 [Anaerostipes sp. 494a]